jgi:hypothetical protein
MGHLPTGARAGVEGREQTKGQVVGSHESVAGQFGAMLPVPWATPTRPAR